MSNTKIANITTIGGVSLALVIANLPLIPSLGILALTGIGATFLTENFKPTNKLKDEVKKDEKNKTFMSFALLVYRRSVFYRG